MKKLSEMDGKMQILNSHKLYVSNELGKLQQQKYAQEFYNEFELKASSKSCHVDEIVNFVYGPFTSRFWMMRKHISLMNRRQLSNQLPFYAWDCITLSLRSGEDVYLLIKDEKDMTTFLKFLIYQMETIDGRRGSAKPFIQKKVKTESKRLGLSSKQGDELLTLENQIRDELMDKVLFKYKIMKVR